MMNNQEILTERMRLRLIDFDDLDAIHRLHSIPAVNEFNTTGIPNSIEETINTIKPLIFENQLDQIENYTFAIESNSSSEFMGLFGFKIGSKKYSRAEVWYKLRPYYWNKGFATEALKAVIHFGFETLKLHRIQAGCAVENIGSIKVLEKAGMIREGRGRQLLPLATGWADNFEYSILETDLRK
jgi:RimJ/RimL family protein N-acetyltransferase